MQIVSLESLVPEEHLLRKIDKARLVYNEAKCKKKMKRLWISSMEDSAIKTGFENLKEGSSYDNLFKSAQAMQHSQVNRHIF